MRPNYFFEESTLQNDLASFGWQPSNKFGLAFQLPGSVFFHILTPNDIAL